MAGISACVSPALDRNIWYRVEWQDSDGLTLERYYRSHRAAEKFSLKIERQLLMEAIADLCGCQSEPSTAKECPNDS
jgi:hypothetical protein